MKQPSHPFSIVEISVGKFNLKIARISEPDRLFDELLAKDSADINVKDDRIPYWSEIWPSSIALAEYITENPEIVNGKNVLEIGCGLGLPGITAGLLNGHVMMTDYISEAIESAEYNWSLNINAKAKTQLLDWRNPEGIKPAEVLLASDIAYESRSFIPILNALKSLVNKNGTILIAEPNRKFAADFFNGLSKAGFKSQKIIKSLTQDGINYTISIYKLEVS